MIKHNCFLSGTKEVRGRPLPRLHKWGPCHLQERKVAPALAGVQWGRGVLLEGGLGAALEAHGGPWYSGTCLLLFSHSTPCFGGHPLLTFACFD